MDEEFANASFVEDGAGPALVHEANQIEHRYFEAGILSALGARIRPLSTVKGLKSDAEATTTGSGRFSARKEVMAKMF